MTEISIGEKDKGTDKQYVAVFCYTIQLIKNKGTDKQYVAVFCYTIQLITIKLCTKFQNPDPSSC